MILEHLHFCLANHAFCVTLTSLSTPSFGVLLSNLSNRNTHVCTSSIRMISFFTVQCDLFTSCNVSNNASLVSARTREGGRVVNQMWTGQKFPNLCGCPLKWIYKELENSIVESTGYLNSCVCLH